MTTEQPFGPRTPKNWMRTWLSKGNARLLEGVARFVSVTRDSIETCCLAGQVNFGPRPGIWCGSPCQPSRQRFTQDLIRRDSVLNSQMRLSLAFTNADCAVLYRVTSKNVRLPKKNIGGSKTFGRDSLHNVQLRVDKTAGIIILARIEPKLKIRESCKKNGTGSLS